MRVLIVNSILIGDDNATGVTMQNMLMGIPDIDYMQFCPDYRAFNHRKMVDTVFIDIKDSVADQIVYKVKNRNGESKGTGNSGVLITSAVNSNPAVDAIKGFCDFLPCNISKANLNRIRKFKPDLIYTQGASIRVFRLANRLSDMLKIPIVFHCMDDWRSVRYTRSVLSYPFNHALNKEMIETNKRGVVNLGICKKMADFYSKEYHRPYSYASNCVFEFNEEEYVPDLSKPMKILFSGGLHFHRGDRLFQVGKLIEKMNAEGRNIELMVYAPEGQAKKYAEVYKPLKHTHCLPYVPKEEQIDNLKSADILMHVESDNAADNKNMKYSFSTKLPEYFSVRRAVLGLGRRDIASIDYIQSMGCGMTAESIGELESCIVKLYDDVNLRKKYADQALYVAEHYHSQEAVQERIKKVFIKTYNSWNAK